MSPEMANVCIINDDEVFVEVTSTLLEKHRHRVVLTATTLNEALNAIPRFRDLGVQVALVDGNLTRDDRSGDDGRKVIEAIKTQAPEVITVGCSGSGHVRGATANYDLLSGPRKLIELINGL